MEKKIDILKKAMGDNDIKTALRTAKNFFRGLTKEQHSIISRGYECLIRPDFYRSLGFDPDKCITDGLNTIRTIYSL